MPGGTQRPWGAGTRLHLPRKVTVVRGLSRAETPALADFSDQSSMVGMWRTCAL